jgi:TonB family protein
MRNKSYLWLTLITLLGLIIMLSFACKKRDLNNEMNTVGIDTTSLDLNVPEDTTSNGSFKLTEYDTPPVPINNPMPVYPVQYRNSGIQGVVLLDVEVLPDGKVGEVKVLKSLLSSEGGLDDMAKAAVKGWIFKPALFNKKPIAAHVNIPIPFALKQ